MDSTIQRKTSAACATSICWIKKIVFTAQNSRKEQARSMKAADRQNSNDDPKHCVVTFDLQKVLCCPSGKVGTIFYKRKLATYNLTVFDMRSKKGSCFMWDETVAKRGSCEIASCLWLWLQTLPETVEKVTLYSDSCSGQNKNLNILTMMLAAVHVFKPIKQNDHKYLETGHTQMEVDSMHATIERASHSA